MAKTEVLIIGAGPSGMVSALCLAKLGVSSIIVERNAGVSEHPKAHELNARSIEILEGLGISSEDLAEEAAPFNDGSRILFCKTINEEYGRIDLFDDEARRAKYEQHLKSITPYLNLSQTELEKILLRKVHENPLIDIRFQHQWESLTQDDSSVNNQILDRQTGNTFAIKSQYVLAADGAGSRCRKFVNIPFLGPDKVDDFVSAYFENNLREHVQTPAKLFWIFNPESVGTFIAHHIEKRWVYMQPVYLDYEKKETFTKAYLENRIKKALGDDSLDIDVKSISYWRMSAQIAESYRKNRVFLVGDAAHRFPPIGGLGMNTGIPDAHNIAWKLQAVIQGWADETFLDTYEAERKPIAEQNCEECLFNYHKILEVIEAFGLGRNDLKKLAKFKNTFPATWLPAAFIDKIIRLGEKIAGKKMDKFHSNPDLKEKVLNTIADQIAHFDRIGLDIGYSYEQGAIIPDGTELLAPNDKVTEYIPSTRPGARFPHLNFQKKTAPTSSHDLLDYRFFTLFIREKGRDWETALTQLSPAIQQKTKVVRLDELGLSETVYTALICLCEIEVTGALLIRPDGHVAWRIKTFEGDAVEKLQQVFQQFFQNKTNMNYENH
ncbi:MAG: FAD-dependent monooxygenase [Ignavibacteria bacterium]|nr:FAD-dependent monooxygenase [Ignavibacteria bacterium]